MPKKTKPPTSESPFPRGAFDYDTWTTDGLLPKPSDPEDPKDIASFWHTPEQRVGRMTKEQLVQFVEDYCDGSKVFTSEDIRKSDQDCFGMVFMCASLGAFTGWSDEDRKEVGIVYEYWDQAGPRSINGYPIFFSMRIMHKEDWEKAKKAIANEFLRRKERAKGIADDL